MAGEGVSSDESWKSSMNIMTVLGSALLEWLLMFMLFLNGIFAYIITRFACYCELPVPCLLCSRLDHVLGGERVGFYWDLICGSHKSEISSLVLCHFHNKLVDVHGMCENCLFSFATKDKSNTETYRLLVGKVGADPDNGIDEAPLLDDHEPLASTMKRCNCCNELWSSRHHPQTVLRLKSVESEGAELDVPLFTEFRQNRNDVERRDEVVASSFVRGNVEDAMPHFGYKELNITSETESEGHISDNEDSRALVCETNSLQGDLPLESAQLESQIITLAEDSTRVTLFGNEGSRVESVQMGPQITMIADDAGQVSSADLPIPTSKPSELTSQVQYIIEHHDSPSVTPSSAIGHGLEELNRPENDNQAHGSPLAELIHLDDEPRSSEFQDQLKVHPSPFNELINIDNVPKSLNVEDVSIVQSENCEDLTRAGEIGQMPVDESVKIHEDKSEPMTTDLVGSKKSTDSGLQTPKYLDLGDAYRLAISNRGRQLSGKLLEQLSGKDSTRVSEDLKLLLSQLSASRGIELPLNETLSPRVSGNLEELKTYDSSASIAMQILQKRISLERNDSRVSLDRNESGIDSLDVSIVSEIEGEIEPDRLKRQVEHDKKLMSRLCKELEEERNASAIAANQALAMITRLQEEKATMQMEALA
ncbi:hypothetical protein Ancab_000945 [Ancistrocladus abbreviatus]